jgi:flagellar biosynthetic protein FlhB
MAEDKESQTEQPTEKRIHDALNQGNIPVSREAIIFSSFIGMLITFVFLIKDKVYYLLIALQRVLDDPSGWTLKNGSDAVSFFVVIAREAAWFLVPILVVFMVSGLVASVAQNRPQIVFDRLQPKFSRISPKAGWERIFGLRGQTELLKSTLKFFAILIIVSFILYAERNDFLKAMFLEPDVIPELILTVAVRLLAAVSVATLVLVAADLVWTRFHWRRDLRMTKQEVKDEHKQAEGDPMVKARLRSVALDRFRKHMMSAVPRATLVIANPTHYAIALRYVREEGGAPLVLAKGQDLIALKIRQIAEEYSIPVIEDKALARSMYDVVEVDKMIPAEFYRAVAELIHFLYARTPQKRPIN